MKVAIHQPQYFPWPRYLHKVISADLFVYLDTVQFSKNGVQNRNQVRVGEDAHWLTLSVSHSSDQEIRETRLANRRDPVKHFRTLQANYAGTAGFDRHREALEALLVDIESDALVDYAIGSTEWLLDALAVETERVRASELPEHDEAASKLVAALCADVGASVYRTGRGALDYLDPAHFRAVDCGVEVQTWDGLEYPQRGAPPFVPDLSSLDVVLNDPDGARRRIEEAGGWELWEAAAQSGPARGGAGSGPGTEAESNGSREGS